MANEADNLVLVMLRDIRATQEKHGAILDQHTARFDRLEKRIEAAAKVSRYALGQAGETHLRQTEQEERMDELFSKLEKLLNEPQT